MSDLKVNEVKTDIIKNQGGTSAMTVDSTGAVSFANTHNLQMFKINANVTFATSGALVTAYTDAHDSGAFKRVGAAWSVSSGVFTPSVTGLYEIMLIACLQATADNRYVQFDYKRSTTSGSGFTTHTMYAAMPRLNSSTTYSEFNFPRYYNITNASTFRFKLEILAENTNVVLRGGSSNGESILMFKRLADAQ